MDDVAPLRISLPPSFDSMANDDKRLGKYLLKSVLGQGGMGTVYLALDTRLRREVALKVLPREFSKDADAVKRFLREGQAAARLSHPNVVAIFDVDQQRGHTFLVMELVSGGSAHDLIKQGYLAWPEATRIIAEACRGLVAAHSAGLIHRDIKPANILLSKDGTVKLSDFGLVKVADDETTRDPLTKTGAVLGTPDFMSPEQCQGEKLDERSDIYSLGATYFALLTRRPPFVEEKPLQTMFAHCSKPVPDPRSIIADLPAACADVVMKSLSKKRMDRFKSADEFLAALLSLLGSSPTDAASQVILRSERQPMTSIGAEMTSSGTRNTPTLLEGVGNATQSAATSPSTSGPAPTSPPDEARMATTITRLSRITRRRGFWPMLGGATLLVGLGLLMLQRPNSTTQPESNGSEQSEQNASGTQMPVLKNGRANQNVPAEVTLVRSGETQQLNERVGAIAASPDETELYTAQDNGAITAFNIATRAVVRKYEGLKAASRAVAAARNGKWIAAGSDAGHVAIWDAKAAALITTMTDHRSEISSLSFRPDSQRLAVGAYGELRLYSMRPDGTPEFLRTLGNSGSQPVCYMVKSVKFSPDNRLLAATSWESKQIILWNADNGEFVANQTGLPYESFAVEFLSDNRVVVGSGRGHITIWENPGRDGFSKLSMINNRSDELRSMALLPDGRTLVTAGEWDGPLRLIDLETQREFDRVRNHTYAGIGAVLALPKTRKVVLAGGTENAQKGFLQYWDIVTGAK